jgi:uncharacterized protein YbbC (DUF1343 family)
MKTRVKRHPVRGRGLFAKAPISPGEVIEVCDMIVMDPEEVGIRSRRTSITTAAARSPWRPATARS